MTTLSRRFSRQKIRRSGGRHILRRSLTRPASITSVTSHLVGSFQIAFTTKAISGIICVRLHASPSSDFATRLSCIRRFLSWPMTTRATGFPAHHSGRIGHTPSRVFTRRCCCSPSNSCLRISTFLIRRFHGLLCLHTRTTAGDEFVARLGLTSERCKSPAAHRQVWSVLRVTGLQHRRFSEPPLSAGR